MESLPYPTAHQSWRPILAAALQDVDKTYQKQLLSSNDWLPGRQHIFNAFSLPVDQVNTLLLGESPYPRSVSANGYAFWDAAVSELWSDNGLSKPVNRATSLRNFIKMLFSAEGRLAPPIQPMAIAALDKTPLVATLNDLFHNMLKQGFLLLNASLVLSGTTVKQDAQYWQPFLLHVLRALKQHRPQVKLLLFGKVANALAAYADTLQLDYLAAEHPYNISFISNKDVLTYFSSLQLLRKTQ